MITIPKVWELISYFKDECHSRGWITSKNEDWIKLDNEFHNFLWARNIHPSTFKKVVAACKCAIKQGVSYQVVNVAYTAWLFLESPPQSVVHTVVSDPNLARKTAIYDLSNVYADKPVCSKLNGTNSKVFQEFENFLKRKWGVEFKPTFGFHAKDIEEQLSTCSV